MEAKPGISRLPSLSFRPVRAWRAMPIPSPVQLPFVVAPAPQAGFPSPAADYLEEVLDLHELLVRNAPATFYTRVAGSSLIDAGIYPDDIIVVDRSVSPRSGAIVVAAYQGEMLVKRLHKRGKAASLLSENASMAETYKPLPINDEVECEIWGVVVGVVRKL